MEQNNESPISHWMGVWISNHMQTIVCIWTIEIDMNKDKWGERYGGYRHADLNDRVTWYTVIFLFFYFLIAGLTSFK